MNFLTTESGYKPELDDSKEEPSVCEDKQQPEAMPCLLAEPANHEQGDERDSGLLRVPMGDMRPNSAPAVIPKMKPMGGIDLVPLNKADVTDVFVDYLSPCDGKSPSGLLSTPIQGSLDFNFPACEPDKHNSFVSSNLEQELRRDAEVRGRSLSPTRSTFDHGFHLTPILEKPECTIATERVLPKTDDLSRLRVQQQQLAHQLRFLQEQEWAILDKRAAEEPPRQPSSSDSTGPHHGVHDDGQIYLQMGSDVHSPSPSTSLHTTPLSPPSVVSDHKIPPLLSPTMLDLNKNPAPPGHRLDAFVGHIAAVAKDQHGCRFLQKLCEEGNPREITIIFEEVVPVTQELMVDPFGNYLMQKLCEYSSDAQRTVLIQHVTAGIPHVSSNMHGTRAVQKVVDQLKTPHHIAIMREALAHHTVTMVKDLNGNHVIQKCLQKFDTADKQFVYDAVTAQLCEVAMHRHGCCVLQRCIDFGSPEQKMQLVTEVVANALFLVQDPYGNYVVQYVLDMDLEVVTTKLVHNFSGSLCELAMNKFSSNVIEKCIKLATPEARAPLLEELCDPTVLPRMLQDQFANYVVQTALSHATVQEFNMLCQAIRPFLHTIKNTPHGKRIEMKINRKPEPPVSPGQTPLKPSAGRKGGPSYHTIPGEKLDKGRAGGYAGAAAVSNINPLAQPYNSWGGWKNLGHQAGQGQGQGQVGWNSAAPATQRTARSTQRLRADAPAYAPKKSELHIGVPPTAQW